MALGKADFALFAFLASLAGWGLYIALIRDMVFVQMGVGRTIQPISDFPYSCRRIRDPALEACEDMWLSARTRQLFLACSDPASRAQWQPNIGRLNVAGRSDRDHIVVLDIDKPQGDGFSFRTLYTPGYTGVNGDGKLSVIAISGVDYPNENYINFYLNNNRPSIDATTGELANQEETGANATIELFRVTNPASANKAEHVKTFADPIIATPNNIAPREDGSFYFTNDHGPNKAGFWHEWSPTLKTGTVGYCSAAGECRRAEGGISFPNGLVLSRKTGRLYVPSSMSGRITIFNPQPDGDLRNLLMDTIKVGVPLDNMSEDENGDLWVAGIPNLAESLGSFSDPLNIPTPPASVFRIRNMGRGKKHKVKKVLEDGKGEFLPATTSVVHDVKTGRLFMSGIVAPFITVCERTGEVEKEDAEELARVRDEL